jgi:hypothetical protein
VENGDGTATLPDGGTLRTPGGIEIALPGGSRLAPDGTVSVPIGMDGAAVTYPDGETAEIPPGYTVEILDADSPLPTGLRIYFANPFEDVAATDWFYDDVVFAYTRGLFAESEAALFGADTPVTRGQLAAVLGRLSGADVSAYRESAFSDVDAAREDAPYIAWAESAGIVTGVGDSKFDPDAPVTRQDLTVMLLRYAKLIGAPLPETANAAFSADFTDGADIAEYARDAAAAFSRAQIVRGRPGNIFDPRSGATRAEVSAILRRFIKMVL